MAFDLAPLRFFDLETSRQVQHKPRGGAQSPTPKEHGATRKEKGTMKQQQSRQSCTDAMMIELRRMRHKISYKGPELILQRGISLVSIPPAKRSRKEVAELCAVLGRRLSWVNRKPLAVQFGIADCCWMVKLNQNDVLFREGDVGDAFYITLKGKLAVVRQRSGGRDEYLGYLREDYAFGEIALIGDAQQKVRTSTVKALKESVIIGISKADFNQLLESDFQGQAEAFRSFLASSSLTGRSVDPSLFGSKFFESASLVKFDKGKLIPMDSQSRLYFIYEGQASLYIPFNQSDSAPGRKPHTNWVATLGPGEHMGLNSVFQELKFGAMAQCDTDVKAFEVPLDMFFAEVPHDVIERLRSELAFRMDYYFGRVSTPNFPTRQAHTSQSQSSSTENDANSNRNARVERSGRVLNLINSDSAELGTGVYHPSKPIELPRLSRRRSPLEDLQLLRGRPRPFSSLY